MMRVLERPHLVRLYLWFWDPMDGQAVYILPSLSNPEPGQVYFKIPVVMCWLN